MTTASNHALTNKTVFCIHREGDKNSRAQIEQDLIDNYTPPWNGEGEKLLKVMELIQTHVFTILAGNELHKEPLIAEIDRLLVELEMVRAESKTLGH